MRKVRIRVAHLAFSRLRARGTFRSTSNQPVMILQERRSVVGDAEFCNKDAAGILYVAVDPLQRAHAWQGGPLSSCWR